MIIYYDWNYCELDKKQCVRGSKNECPDPQGVLEQHCKYFRVVKKTEDVEK
jgi:hypothetical protein